MEHLKEVNEDEKAEEASIIASKGGKARAMKLSPERRKEIAKLANKARWEKAKKNESEILIPDQIDRLPEAKYRGVLKLADDELPCYVLDNGERVISRIGATEFLTGIKGGGGLENYLGAKRLKPFIDLDLTVEKFVEFRLRDVENLPHIQVKGLPTGVLIDICRVFVAAWEASEKTPPEIRLTTKQKEIAFKASMFLAACAKVGLDALVDEATGYQYDRAEDALQIKLRAYLEDEMRKWERTFPDELWKEFGRLTNWKGAIHNRPKYWGKLVMELIYEYLDPDVALWLKENAPKPKHGQNYHQWLSSQYGLKKLVEHIWKVIGIASTCYDIPELKEKMGHLYGGKSMQMNLFLPPNSNRIR